MKPNKPDFWIVISAVYLAFLLAVTWIYNPDFKELKNSLLLIPLFGFLFVSLCLKHTNDEEATDYIWITKFSIIIVAAIFVVFINIINFFK